MGRDSFLDVIVNYFNEEIKVIGHNFFLQYSEQEILKSHRSNAMIL